MGRMSAAATLPPASSEGSASNTPSVLRRTASLMSMPMADTKFALLSAMEDSIIAK